MESRKELEFKGIGVSRGIVSGPVLLVKMDELPLPDHAIVPGQTDEEVSRLEKALNETRLQLREIQERVGEAMGSESAGIFEAHLHVLDDPGFLDEVYRELREKCRNIEIILFEVSERYAQTLLKMQDDYLRERATDIRDVTRRILQNLMGAEGDWLSGLTSPHILVAHDIAPSDMAALDRRHILGIITEMGSPTAHSAILARAMELPAIVGMQEISRQLEDGDRVILDGLRGLLIQHPSPEREADYGRISHSRDVIRSRLEALKDKEAVTLDGHSVVLSANIELSTDVDTVWAHGARGIGLYRSEYLYLINEGNPSEETQYQAYAEVAKKIMPESVIIRTLDLGGDKLPKSFNLQEESNPFLGCRAIRLCLNHPEMFKTQLRALLRAAVHNPNLRIMYPMVSRTGEVDQANALLEECKGELAAKGIPFRADLEVGVMIEIPSAALIADRIAPKVKFFSIGTNDLVQYTLAVDRGNERIAHLYEPTHPAVLQLIQMTIDAGRRHGIWTGVCGEVAGNPLLVPLLVGMGVDELSMSSSAVPLVKEVIRRIRFSEAQALAAAVREMPAGPEVLELCRAMVRKASPEILELAE